MFHGGGAKILERSIKDSSENSSMRFLITSPSGAPTEAPTAIVLIVLFWIPYSPRCAVAISTKGVVIEGEGCSVFTEVYVGFGSCAHRENVY